MQKIPLDSEYKKIQHDAVLRTSEASEVFINKQILMIDGHIKLKENTIRLKKKTTLRDNGRSKKIIRNERNE